MSGNGESMQDGRRDPLVSTVIPTYNRTKEIARSVASAVAQTYPADRHEIIVVDDGSRDPAATEAAVAPFRDRIRLIKKANGGVSSARNEGVLQSKGELIAFLDSDDAWRPEKLRRTVDYLKERPEYGMVLCDFDVVDEDGSFRHSAPRREQFPRDGMILEDVLLHPRLVPSTSMVRRAVLDDVGLFDESLQTAEDVELLLRVARRYPIGIVETPLALYTRNRDESDSLSARSHSWDDYMRVMRSFIARHANEIAPDVRHRALLRASVRNARGMITSGWYRDGLRLCAEAALHARDADGFVQVAKLGALLGRNVAARAVRTVRPAA